MRNLIRWLAAAAIPAAALLSVPPLDAQSLAHRVDAVRDGTVRFGFATRPGVCGDGSESFWSNSSGYETGWHVRPCIHGPLEIELTRSGGETVNVHDCIGCGPRDTGDRLVDLGEVAPADAARYLIAASPSLSTHGASKVIAAATFADGVDVSPELTKLVKNGDVSTETRKNALFWLGQSDASTHDLGQLYDQLQPRALREQFTFVLSQRRDDGAAIDKLIDIAQHDDDFSVRKKAMFWLGQTHDPKAIKFFQTILAR